MSAQPPAAAAPAGIDVVWLKKDVRLHDHAPLSLAAGSGRPCLVLYLYEPDQLSEKTVHGSHVAFVNEGLVDLDLRLAGRRPLAEGNDDGDGNGNGNGDSSAGSAVYGHRFRCLTVCYAGAAFTLRTLHRQRPIRRILTHLETGHLRSFARDKAVRRWCRSNGVPIHEFNQTGVTRCLSDRDDFAKNFNAFLDRPPPETPTSSQLEDLRGRLVDPDAEGIRLHGRCLAPTRPEDVREIPPEHRGDRGRRQRGGERAALGALRSFLSRRGADYSSGISSPNTSWTTGSRLSPYLTWGHVSLRYVINATKQKQEELRAAKRASSKPSPWLRSLSSFQSRMHWRSHFMQKLESQPSMEEQDQCLAFSHLRRQPGDFRQEHYDAWCEGRTGFPFADACMRCLIDCGWLNFRMRAMLVSFATYNLWLDWKRIAGHLARVFLDYEPGIHYPQLQMQAGTTGINAMRVYNVTKQGRDQDPDGTFIRRYVAELRNVPDEYIHEPCSMPVSVQRKCGVVVGGGKAGPTLLGFKPMKQSTASKREEFCSNHAVHYPSPIVDEKASAKTAKDRLSAVRKKESTKAEAHRVFLKHGSRQSRRADRDGAKPKALSTAVKRVKVDRGQTSLNSWKAAPPKQPKGEGTDQNPTPPPGGKGGEAKAGAKNSSSIARLLVQEEVSDANESKEQLGWSCKSCTYLNEKPLALACTMCGSVRQ